ncbi:MAG: clostripain-related cysteine peptidase [Thermoplasmata archaeon]
MLSPFRTVVLTVLALLLLAPINQPRGEAGARLAEWSILVYLDADNNLEGAGIHDLNEMETVGSTPELNIIVQMDRADGEDTTNGNWTGAKRFYVTRDSDPETVSSRELADLGEVNMGDPATFITFAKLAVDNYPAKRYGVIFWDHGGGWYGACWDDKDDDYLDLANITECVRALRQHLGRDIDLVGFDACLMSGIEVLYALRGTCCAAALSGTTEPNDGWPYDWILPTLALRPSMTPEELAAEIVDDYVDSYTDGKEDPEDTPQATMSAWDMEKVESLFEHFNQMSMRLALRAMTYNAYLREVRARTQGYDPGHVVFLDITNYPLYDVYDFCEQFLSPAGGPVVGLLLDSGLKENLLGVQRSIELARIAERHGPRFPDGHGLTMYFPSGDSGVVPGTPRTQYDFRYDTLDFSRELFWDDFLKAFFDVRNLPNTPPYVKISSPADGSVLDASNRSVIVYGTAFDAGQVTAVQIRIDGGKWRTAEGREAWSYRWDISRLSGRHTITVRATDGLTESQEVSHTYYIRAASNPQRDYGPAMVAAGAFLILAAGGIIFWARKRGVRLREIPERLRAAWGGPGES